MTVHLPHAKILFLVVASVISSQSFAEFRLSDDGPVSTSTAVETSPLSSASQDTSQITAPDWSNPYQDYLNVMNLCSLDDPTPLVDFSQNEKEELALFCADNKEPEEPISRTPIREKLDMCVPLLDFGPPVSRIDGSTTIYPPDFIRGQLSGCISKTIGRPEVPINGISPSNPIAKQPAPSEPGSPRPGYSIPILRGIGEIGSLTGKACTASCGYFPSPSFAAEKGFKFPVATCGVKDKGQAAGEERCAVVTPNNPIIPPGAKGVTCVAAGSTAAACAANLADTYHDMFYPPVFQAFDLVDLWRTLDNKGIGKDGKTYCSRIIMGATVFEGLTYLMGSGYVNNNLKVTYPITLSQPVFACSDPDSKNFFLEYFKADPKLTPPQCAILATIGFGGGCRPV